MKPVIKSVSFNSVEDADLIDFIESLKKEKTSHGFSDLVRDLLRAHLEEEKCKVTLADVLEVVKRIESWVCRM